MKNSIVLAALLVTGLSGVAFAQGGNGPGNPACAADIQKFCADKKGPDRAPCMDANTDKLSDACKAVRVQEKAAHANRAAGGEQKKD